MGNSKQNCGSWAFAGSNCHGQQSDLSWPFCHVEVLEYATGSTVEIELALQNGTVADVLL